MSGPNSHGKAFQAWWYDYKVKNGLLAHMDRVTAHVEAAWNAALAQSETVQPSVCWVPCAKHQGLWFNTAIATAAPMLQVCPHCESEKCQHEWTYYPNAAGSKPFNQCSKCRVVREV